MKWYFGNFQLKDPKQLKTDPNLQLKKLKEMEMNLFSIQQVKELKPLIFHSKQANSRHPTTYRLPPLHQPPSWGTPGWVV